jgi:hypothetical protein
MFYRQVIVFQRDKDEVRQKTGPENRGKLILEREKERQRNERQGNKFKRNSVPHSSAVHSPAFIRFP